MRIRKGVKLLEEQEGQGDLVERQREYILSTRITLSQGEVLPRPYLSRQPGDGFVEYCARVNRCCMLPGLFYALQGMRIGGYRKVVISPHLAYGDKGVPGEIPPNAALTVEIRVLEEVVPGEEKRERKPREPVVIEAGMLTQDQLCQRYQITRLMLWRRRKAGYFPAPIMAGRMVRWRPSTIEQWEADGQPRVSPYLDEGNWEEEVAFERLTPHLDKPPDPADQPVPGSSSHVPEQRVQWAEDVDDYAYNDRILDLRLELALLIDEAGQWYGPPLEKVLNDRGAARYHGANLRDVIKKIVSA